jgi:hypothetical protein
MPAKIVASNTEIKVNIAENRQSLDRPLKVLGSEHSQHISVDMTANTTVHWE